MQAWVGCDDSVEGEKDTAGLRYTQGWTITVKMANRNKTHGVKHKMLVAKNKMQLTAPISFCKPRSFRRQQ